MSWFNKRKVTVDTKNEAYHERLWTLIYNKDCVVKKFYDSRGVVQYLYDDGFKAKTWIDEKVQHEVAKELERRNHEKFNKHFTFYADKEIAPFILNKMTALECVGEWSIDNDALLENYVQIDYDATRQVLFQTENGVVVKKED